MKPARVSVRATPVLKGNKLGGYAVVFEQTTDLGWLGNERMARGSLDGALKASDPRATYNHDPNRILGRLSARTLRLSLDSTGLEYEIDLPDTSYARDLRELVERGDVNGASFAFVPDLSTWDDETQTRTHTRVAQLVDVSPVAWPAYPGASTEARCLPAGASTRSRLIRARARVTLRTV